MSALKKILVAALWVLALQGATPAYASSIQITVGDKDGFGLGLTAGQPLPCLTNPNFDPNDPNPAQAPCIAPILDWRSLGEQAATNGAQLTDTYSALYMGAEWDCPAGCTKNGATGSFVFPFIGQLTSASIELSMADFQSAINGAMGASINGIPIDFSFNHGYRNTAIETFLLTPSMLAAANLAGEVRLFLDHRSNYDPGNPANTFGSFDYIAFDYAQLNAVAIPEPGSMALLGAGLLAIAALQFRTRRQSR